MNIDRLVEQLDRILLINECVALTAHTYQLPKSNKGESLGFHTNAKTIKGRICISQLSPKILSIYCNTVLGLEYCREIKTKMLSRNMQSRQFNPQIGLDIDDTITAAPRLFAEISAQCRKHGGRVHIVTSRSVVGRRETIEELRDYGIAFDAIHFIGDMSRANTDCPHMELDWFQRYLWQKVSYAMLNGLRHFVDDDPKVLSLFATYAPGIVATSAESLINAIELALNRRGVYPECRELTDWHRYFSAAIPIFPPSLFRLGKFLLK